MSEKWNRESILEFIRGYQGACVLGAAAELDLFDTLIKRPALKAEEIAEAVEGSERAAVILADALAALGFLSKDCGKYTVPAGLTDILSLHGNQSVVSMIRHQMNCLRRWSDLARTVREGQPLKCPPSILGEQEDLASFIGAMDNVSAPFASQVVKETGISGFKRLLDIGGGPGTWTVAWLSSFPSAEATYFDLAPVVPIAKRRIDGAGLSSRTTLVGGDFYRDELPAGSDLAWVSAIIHQNSRDQNRELFKKIARALLPKGCMLIRDIVMEESKCAPPAGALFAVNMLCGTAGGGTYTLREIKEDLEQAGFTGVKQVRSDPGMNSLVMAVKS